MKLFKKVVVSSMIVCILLALSIPVYASTPSNWNEIKGTYARDDNSQYNNGVLSLMYLDNDVVMFEFFIMEGSESEDAADNFCLAGAFYLDESGNGIYEHPKTENVKLEFTLTGGSIAVKQTGDLPINVSGKYNFVEAYVEVTEDAAVEILEQLPTAATSLNHNNGEYKLAMSEEMVDGWFYDVKANFVDTNQLIAEFYIARDMSSVYRVDTDAPILIWGSAQPLLDATYMSDKEALFGVTSNENDGDLTEGSEDDTSIEAKYVSIAPATDVIAIGENTPIVVTVPGMLNYTLNCKSLNPEIATIDDKGVITAVAEGEATISGTITIDGAEKPFEFTVASSDDERASMSDTNPDSNPIILWIIIPVIVVILLVVITVILKKKKNKL